MTVDLGHDDDAAYGLAVSADGTLVAAGRSNGDVGVGRFSADGVVDTSFNLTGTAPSTWAAPTWPGSVAVQSDGEVVLGASSGRA